VLLAARSPFSRFTHHKAKQSFWPCPAIRAPAPRNPNPPWTSSRCFLRSLRCTS
jgi:hypothetical protein